MKVNDVNSLHLEYRHRFQVEFHQLLAQQTFAEVSFRNHDLLFANGKKPFSQTLELCFGCSFDGMALGLSRIWDERCGDLTLISIPNLVANFADHQFLGCDSLAIGTDDRITFDLLANHTIRSRLRVLRTEAFAHNIQVGMSKDRSKSDIKGEDGYNIINREAVAYCRKTLDLLGSLNDQLSFSSSWRKNKSIDEMTVEWSDRHVTFFKHFVSRVK